MPELLEVEMYRRAAERTIGRTIVDVPLVDPRFGRRSPQLAAVLLGCVVVGVRRLGKVLLVDTDAPVLGLRFGMTGMLRVDDEGPIDGLAYGPCVRSTDYDRLRVAFDDGGTLVVEDARRFGSAELDPDLSALGPDASTITCTQLRLLLRGAAPIKAVLLDQARVAGLGNMLVDEILMRAGIDPARPASELRDREVSSLHRAIGVALVELMAAGGSHAGQLSADRRRPGATCPRDGAALLRRRIAGRTTYSCPKHQH